MKDPNLLKVAPPDPYVFKSRLKRKVTAFVDRLGSLLFPRAEAPVPWENIRKIAVLRLDHIGDVLLAMPALEALRAALPRVEIDLFVGSWAQEVAKLSGLKLGIQVFSAPWFDRSRPSPVTWKGIGEFVRTLKQGRYDAAIDLRGDLRHILAMKRAEIPVRIGQVITGGGFLLSHPAVYQPGLHEVERNLDLLTQAGLEARVEKPWPKLLVGPMEVKIAEEASASLGIKGPYIVLHATCLAPAKRWPDGHWRRLVQELPENMDLVVIGTDGEGEDARRIFGAQERKVHFATGLFSLPVLAAFLGKCRLFIGVDSSPAHIAAAVGVPVPSLFSGTNEAAQWGPRGPKVRVLQKKTPCSPCERVDCPFDNECMRLVGVEEVLGQAGLCLKEMGGQDG